MNTIDHEKLQDIHSDSLVAMATAVVVGSLDNNNNVNNFISPSARFTFVPLTGTIVSDTENTQTTSNP